MVQAMPNILLIAINLLLLPNMANLLSREDKEEALKVIHDVFTGNMGSLCLAENFRSIPILLETARFENTRQKVDMAALLLQELGVNHHNRSFADALGKSLILSDRHILSVKVLALNVSTDQVVLAAIWHRPTSELKGPEPFGANYQPGSLLPPDVPWYQDPSTSNSLRSPKFMTSPHNASFRGWWTFPYFSCADSRWVFSYSVLIPPAGRHPLRGYVSVDVDVSNLDVNQCDQEHSNDISIFRGSHKCHNTTSQCVRTAALRGWRRGAYRCVCRPGFVSLTQREPFNGSLIEGNQSNHQTGRANGQIVLLSNAYQRPLGVLPKGRRPWQRTLAAWEEKEGNISNSYEEFFKCHACAPGCKTCKDLSPCLADYNWPFRITLLVVSLTCVVLTLCLICYVFKHRRLKVFKVASPIFLGITLSGCSIMYLEMAAIFPVLDTYSCIATKWSRHLGFCITYTALLMKTWRVSLTYRVKSAHKVKLTDKQLLQWMIPILLVMLIFLGSWTFSDPPTAVDLLDDSGLRFKQCSFNWWDHSIAIGEVLFLAWGVRVCYNVRNAESFYNEAHLISYAIYNIAVVNILMVAFHILLFPHAGPDIKYLLGFIRTQLSTTVTIALVFGPKVVRVLRGQGDQWDNRARARGVTASFSLNGIGLVHEETADLYHENEELKEEIQKLASQIEFMRIVHMETNNRHLRPRPGSYFQTASAQVTILQSPVSRSGFFGRAEESKSASDGINEHV